MSLRVLQDLRLDVSHNRRLGVHCSWGIESAVRRMARLRHLTVLLNDTGVPQFSCHVPVIETLHVATSMRVLKPMSLVPVGSALCHLVVDSRGGNLRDDRAWLGRGDGVCLWTDAETLLAGGRLVRGPDSNI